MAAHFRPDLLPTTQPDLESVHQYLSRPVYPDEIAVHVHLPGGVRPVGLDVDERRIYGTLHGATLGLVKRSRRPSVPSRLLVQVASEQVAALGKGRIKRTLNRLEDEGLIVKGHSPQGFVIATPGQVEEICSSSDNNVHAYPNTDPNPYTVFSSGPQLTAAQFRILESIGRCIPQQYSGEIIYFSSRDIARIYGGISHTTASSYLAELVSAGLISRNRDGFYLQSNNTYHVAAILNRNRVSFTVDISPGNSVSIPLSAVEWAVEEVKIKEPIPEPVKPRSVGLPDESPADLHRRYGGLEDATIVTLAQDHDTNALGELFDRFMTKVYKYIYYRVEDAQVAEDIAGETFMKAFYAIGGYKDQGVPFSAWLYRIASNLVIDRFRRSPAVPPLSLEEKLVASEDRTGVQVEAIFTQQALSEALSYLTDDQRQVVVLKFVDGLSNSEVAGILGKTEGAVKSLQHRALASLGRILGEQPDLDPDVAARLEEHVEDDVPHSFVYNFAVAATRFPGHPLLTEIRRKDPGQAEPLREIVYDVLMPFIDEGLALDGDNDVGNGQLRQEVLYWLLWGEQTPKEISKRLPKGHNVHDVLDEIRIIVKEHLIKKTGRSFEELRRLLRGTGWMLTITPPVRLNLVPIVQRRERLRSPVRPHSTYDPVRLTPDWLQKRFGPKGKSEDELTQADRDRWFSLIDSTVPMKIKAGQAIPLHNGARVLVHSGSIIVFSTLRNGELMEYEGGKGIMRRARPNEEKLISDGAPFGFMHPAALSAETASDCVVRLIHPQTEETAKIEDADKRAGDAKRNRADLKKWYDGVAQVTEVRMYGITLDELSKQIAQILEADPEDLNIEGIERPEHLRRALRTLTSQHITILRLSLVDGLSSYQIANKLEITSDAAGAYVHRIRREGIRRVARIYGSLEGSTRAIPVSSLHPNLVK